MHDPKVTYRVFDSRDEGRLLDVLIRAGRILAITLYPLNQALARRLGGRKGWAATLITLLGIPLIVTSTAALASSVGDSVQGLIEDVQQNTLQIPLPNELGGIATAGILGLFVGATLLALGYQIFMGWVVANPVARRPAGDASETAAD
jgi:hypothetical protein